MHTILIMDKKIWFALMSIRKENLLFLDTCNKKADAIPNIVKFVWKGEKLYNLYEGKLGIFLDSILCQERDFEI